MTDAQLRLECLRVAANLRVTQGTHLPSSLVPGIIADARSFAGFVLGDDEVAQAVDAFRDELARHRSKAAGAEQRAWLIDYRYNAADSNDPLPEPGGPFFTGGFRDGPASEP